MKKEQQIFYYLALIFHFCIPQKLASLNAANSCIAGTIRELQ